VADEVVSEPGMRSMREQRTEAISDAVRSTDVVIEDERGNGVSNTITKDRTPHASPITGEGSHDRPTSQ
jgi:hypothetical protein